MDNKLLSELIEYLEKLHYIPASDIPGISLYMDQVTGFMEEQLSAMKREPSDKVLTKTMINNYAKNKLLPSPEKKRYSRNHILILLFIYYYKGIISLSDIEEILRPLNEEYFLKDAVPSLGSIYEEVFSLEELEKDRLIRDITEKYSRAQGSFSKDSEMFSALSDEQREELQLFAFVSELAYDVYLKKQLIEKISDRLRLQQEERKNTGKEDKKKSK